MHEKFRIVRSRIFVHEGTFGKVEITFYAIRKYSLIRYSVSGHSIKNEELFDLFRLFELFGQQFDERSRRYFKTIRIYFGLASSNIC